MNTLVFIVLDGKSYWLRRILNDDIIPTTFVVINALYIFIILRNLVQKYYTSIYVLCI